MRLAGDRYSPGAYEHLEQHPHRASCTDWKEKEDEQRPSVRDHHRTSGFGQSPQSLTTRGMLPS
jgi:hypothetical protein